MTYTYPLTLDIYSANSTYRAKQNDAGSRYLLATINANGVLQTVPATATVSLKVVKPDDTKTLTAGTVSNGKILVELTNQTLAVPGMAYCELQIIESNPTTLLKTIRFQLLIDAEVYSDTVAESTDEFTALTVALADINEVKNDIITLEATKEPNLPVTPLLPTEKFLNGNKAWAVPAHNKLSDLNTDTEYQHMSSAEKTKLNTLETAVTELQADVNTLELTNLAYDKTIYGFYWDKTTNTFSRTMSARGAIVNIGVDSEVVYNEFDLSTLFRDIEEVTDASGNVFVRFPRMYLKKTDTATYYSAEVSRVEFKGSYLPQCFWDFENEVELDYVDIGKHIASLSDDTTKLESKPGKYPLINKNIVQMRTLAQANGAGYQQLDIHAVDFLQTLFIIEQATVDSQSKLFGYANGRYTATDLAVITESDTNRVVLSNAAAAPYEVGQSISIGITQGGNQIFYGRTIISIEVKDASNKSLIFSGDPVTITAGNMVYNTSYKTGFSSGIASSVGSLVSNSSGKHPFAWHGIESLYGDIWQFVDGLNINDNQSWVCRDADDYASNLFAAPYEKLSYINATSNNYVLTRGFDRAHPYAQLPTAVGAVGDSQYKDYYYQATGQRIARVGGLWYYGSSAGLFCWRLYNSSADTSLAFGGRLLKKAL